MATTCTLIDGIDQSFCDQTIGGVEVVYIANKALVSSIIKGAGSPSLPELVTTLTTVNALNVSAPAFFEYFPNDVSSTWTDTGAPLASNSGTFYTPSVTMVFGSNDATKVNTIKLLGQNKLVAIVKENSGKYFLLGGDLGLKLTSAVYTPGTAYADARAWTVTLAGGSAHPSPEVDDSVITSSIIVGM